MNGFLKSPQCRHVPRLCIYQNFLSFFYIRHSTASEYPARSLSIQTLVMNKILIDCNKHDLLNLTPFSQYKITEQYLWIIPFLLLIFILLSFIAFKKLLPMVIKMLKLKNERPSLEYSPKRKRKMTLMRTGLKETTIYHFSDQYKIQKQSVSYLTLVF